MTSLKGGCEFSSVTRTTIAIFRQQHVFSPVNILSSNVRFEAISLCMIKMSLFPYCAPTKKNDPKKGED